MMKIFLSLLLTLVGFSALAEPIIKPGDRVAIIGNTFADQLRIHGYLETRLLAATAENPIQLRNLGWGGDQLGLRDRPTNFPKEALTLTEHKTDVIIACFGMGESFAGEKGLSDFEKKLVALVKEHQAAKYNGKSAPRLVLVSPIAYENRGTITPRVEERNQNLAAYTAAMKKVAEAEGVGFVDLYAPTSQWLKEGISLTRNGIHLTPFGYWAVSEVLAGVLVGAEAPWQIELQTKQQTAKASKAVLSEIAEAEGGWQFQLQPESWPSPGPPEGAEAIPGIDMNTLKVQDLAPGSYELSIDGEVVAKASHQEWAAGVVIVKAPFHRALEVYREKVNDKNLQFVYSWKALNQVHIVGERKTSPSGKALPQEVVEFNKLAKARDLELSKGIELNPERWSLRPVSQ